MMLRITNCTPIQLLFQRELKTKLVVIPTSTVTPWNHHQTVLNKRNMKMDDAKKRYDSKMYVNSLVPDVH